jgi:hypothetical protein
MRISNQFCSLFDMLETSATLLSSPGFNFGIMSERLVNGATQARAEGMSRIILDENTVETIKSSLAGAKHLTDQFDLPVTRQIADNCIVEFIKRLQWVDDRQDYAIELQDAAIIGHGLAHLWLTLRSELQNIIIFRMDSKYSNLALENESQNEIIISNELPDVIEDLQEARRCLAFSLPTACVFHLMRAMEFSVSEISKKLGNEIKDERWGILLGQIHRKIQQLPKGKNKNDWSEIHALLFHVKQAWRNSTMHPKKTYTDDEAKRIYDAVISFMVHLSPLLSQAEE